MTDRLETLLSIERLCCVYGTGAATLPVVADVDLTIGAREFVAIIGPSGCGKSTLLRAIAGLQQPTSGQLRLDGHDGPLLSTVGYMGQNDVLLPWRTVLDNVALGLEVAGLPRAAARARAQAEFGRFGLAGFERCYPSELSGGMRQRAALLRTFLLDRRLYVLDEPLGKLDSLTRLDLQDWLVELWQSRPAAVLLITHDIDEALYLADRIYVMSPRPGRLVLELANDFERPRDYHRLVASSAFQQRKATLLEHLKPHSSTPPVMA